MQWYCYPSDNCFKILQNFEEINVTQAWLKQMSRQFQVLRQQQPHGHLDAIKEAWVSYETVHQIDAFAQYYKKAFMHLQASNWQLDDSRGIYVFWIVNDDGPYQCAFLFPIIGQQYVVISPSPLAQFQS